MKENINCQSLNSNDFIRREFGSTAVQEALGQTFIKHSKKDNHHQHVSVPRGGI